MGSAGARFAASAPARSKHMRSDAVRWIALDTAPTPGGIICSITNTSNSQQVFWRATSAVPQGGQFRRFVWRLEVETAP
eukprot:5950806-Pyramimonas_sp.AAC.1